MHTSYYSVNTNSVLLLPFYPRNCLGGLLKSVINHLTRCSYHLYYTAYLMTPKTTSAVVASKW